MLYHGSVQGDDNDDDDNNHRDGDSDSTATTMMTTATAAFRLGGLGARQCAMPSGPKESRRKTPAVGGEAKKEPKEPKSKQKQDRKTREKHKKGRDRHAAASGPAVGGKSVPAGSRKSAPAVTGSSGSKESAAARGVASRKKVLLPAQGANSSQPFSTATPTRRPTRIRIRTPRIP